MAMKPKRPCRHPGCSVLVEDGYCENHRPKRTGDRSAEAESWRWMYKTGKWIDDLRPNQLLNEQAEQMAALREELEEAREAAAKPAAIEKSANHWDELRAYRRAETAERQAKERVNDLYTSANTALRGAGATLGDTNAAFEALAEKFREDLVELMNAIETGRTALTTAADTLDTLRPEETE